MRRSGTRWRRLHHHRSGASSGPVVIPSVRPLSFRAARRGIAVVPKEGQPSSTQGSFYMSGMRRHAWHPALLGCSLAQRAEFKRGTAARDAPVANIGFIQRLERLIDHEGRQGREGLPIGRPSRPWRPSRFIPVLLQVLQSRRGRGAQDAAHAPHVQRLVGARWLPDGTMRILRLTPQDDRASLRATTELRSG